MVLFRPAPEGFGKNPVRLRRKSSKGRPPSLRFSPKRSEILISNQSLAVMLNKPLFS